MRVKGFGVQESLRKNGVLPPGSLPRSWHSLDTSPHPGLGMSLGLGFWFFLSRTYRFKVYKAL